MLAEFGVIPLPIPAPELPLHKFRAMMAPGTGARDMSSTTRILLGLALGFTIGVAMASIGVPKEHQSVATAEIVGGLWLDALRMTILPLVFSLVITGISSAAGLAAAGSVTRLSFIWFVILLIAGAGVAAVLVPLLLDIWPAPEVASEALRQALGRVERAGEYPGIGSVLRSIVPANVVNAAASGAMLPVVFFALVFGFAVSKIDNDQSFRLTDFFARLRDAMLVVVGWVLAMAPIGVFALAFVVGEKTGLSALGAFAHYLAVVVAMCWVAIIAAYAFAALAGGASLIRFAKAAAPAQAVAISTQSSMASLPAMIRSCEEGLAIPPRITGVTLPLAVVLFRICGPVSTVTIAVYAAHVMNVPLGPAQLLAGGIVAVIMVFATATGIPSQVLYMATLTPILSAMGVPIDILGLLIAVEAFHDMFRTTANVTMDVAVTTSVARWARRAPGDPVTSAERA